MFVINFNKKKLRALEERIKDLERLYEALMGSNSILERELDSIKQEKKELQEKLFEVSGINPRVRAVAPAPEQQRQPVQIGRQGKPWNQVRDSLELAARAEHWENKKSQMEKRIAELESQVLEKKEEVKEDDKVRSAI